MIALPWPDVVLVRMGLSIAVAWAVVVVFLAVVRSLPALRPWGVVVAVVGLAACPLVIPAGYPGARALAVFVCYDAIFRVIDVARRRGASTTTEGFWSELRFFVPFPVLLVTGEEWAASRPATSSIRRAVIRTMFGLAFFLVAWGVLFGLQKSALLRSSFVLDHVAKTALYAVTLVIIGLLSSGLERLAGFDALPLMNWILFSRTPADFWRRYNMRVHRWLIRNVLRRGGGVQHPVWGVALVFFVSAVFHEAAFDIALSRVDGSQFVFFMLQIPAVLASPALERFAKRGPNARVVAHAITIAWFVVTSVFFFRGIGEIFPIYYTAPMPGAVFGEWRF